MKTSIRIRKNEVYSISIDTRSGERGKKFGWIYITAQTGKATIELEDGNSSIGPRPILAPSLFSTSVFDNGSTEISVKVSTDSTQGFQGEITIETFPIS